MINWATSLEQERDCCARLIKLAGRTPTFVGVLTLTFLVTTLASTPVIETAAPAPRPHAIEVGVVSGAFVPAVGPTSMDTSAESGLSVGLRLGYFPLTFFGLEGEAVHLASRLGSDDVGGYAARGHMTFQLPGRLTPFLLGGTGVLGRPTELDPESSLAAHWGGGLRWYTHGNVHVRLDVRHIVAFAAETRQDVEATLGIGFTLFAVDPSPSTLVGLAPRDGNLASVQ